MRWAAHRLSLGGLCQACETNWGRGTMIAGSLPERADSVRLLVGAPPLMGVSTGKPLVRGPSRGIRRSEGPRAHRSVQASFRGKERN
jgi:hypothetical protein